MAAPFVDRQPMDLSGYAKPLPVQPLPEPKAVVTRISRFTWRAEVTDGWWVWDQAFRFTRRRAERAGARMLYLYQRRKRWAKEEA